MDLCALLFKKRLLLQIWGITLQLKIWIWRGRSLVLMRVPQFVHHLRRELLQRIP